MPVGGFITLGCLFALTNYLVNKAKEKAGKTDAGVCACQITNEEAAK
jgi:hypothetical protein